MSNYVIQIGCEWSGYCLHSAVQFGTYIVCLMTYDKFYAIKYPHKSASFSTPKRCKIAICTIFAFVCIYNIPYHFITKLLIGPLGPICQGYAGTHTIIKIFSWVTFVMNGLIPLCSLVIMNIHILYLIRSTRHRFKKQSRGHNDIKSKKTGSLKSVENQLTRMTLFVACAFLIFMTPGYVRFVLTPLVSWDASVNRFAKYVFFYVVTLNLYYTQSAVNFYLYCLSGEKLRKDLVNLFKGKKPSRSDSMGSSSSIRNTRESDIYTVNSSL